MSTQQPQAQPATERQPVAPRLVGVDIARALAIFGMFTVHLGAGAIGLLDQADAETFHFVTRGNSSALFAFLAGVSLALISGRAEPYRGTDAQRVAARVVVRAALLIMLGGLVELLETPIAIILVYYGLFFLLALPLLTLRAPALTVVAVAVGFLGPQVSYLLRDAWGLDEVDTVPSLLPGLTDLFLTGYYPAFTFMAFVIAGMAVGRTDLRATATRLGLAGTGAGLVLLGYGGSWLALRVLGGLDRLATIEFGAGYALADATQRAGMRDLLMEEVNTSIYGEVPTTDPAWLLVASPHSGTTFDILGCVGVGLLVLVAFLFLGEWLPVPLYPLSAAGSMALSVYVGHLFFIAALDASPWEPAPYRLELFILGAMLFATLWRPLLGKGPLERVLAAAATAGERAVFPSSPAGRG